MAELKYCTQRDIKDQIYVTKWKTEVISKGPPSQWTAKAILKAILSVKSKTWFTSSYKFLNWHPFKHPRSACFPTVYKESQESEAAKGCVCELGPSTPWELPVGVQQLESQARVAKCFKKVLHLGSHCHGECDGMCQGKWNGMWWEEWDGKWRGGRLTVL